VIAYKINKKKMNIFIIIISWLKWEKNNKERVSPNALSITPSTFTNSHTEFNSRRKLPELFLKLET